ncbi:MAG TPA: copper homeostasis protein CutC [Clostridiales bacterium]|nr:copper homeostasis protein CutC [Clostridiales bacterium]
MEHILLEACVDGVDSALAAARGGANRMELCGNLIIGGTTPSPLLYKEIRKYTDIPIHILIRPRFGDFCYSDYEYSIMKEEVKMFCELGADGIVIGVLLPDGTLDMERMGELIALSGGMSVTLSRAFDVCRDPYEALDRAKELEIHTILTSGQAEHCLKGKRLIRDLVQRSEGKIDILVGGGVDAGAIQELYPATLATSYHMSGKVVKDSRMVFRKEGVNMGLPFMSEYEIWQTDGDKIRLAKEVLGNLSGKMRK